MFIVNTSNFNIHLNYFLSDKNSSYYSPSWSDNIRFILIVYFLLISLLGLVGNLVALLGSIFKNAIKTDRISVVLLRSLATFDIFITIFLYIPLLSCVICNKWVLGTFFCGFSYYVYDIMLISKLLVIAIISCYRLWLIKKPPSVKRELKQFHFVILCVLVIPISFIPYLIMEIVFNENEVFFDPRRMTCNGRNFFGENAIYSLIIMIPFLIVPLITIVYTNIKLIYILVEQARRSRFGFHKRRLFITIKLIRLFIVMTYLPPIVSMIMEWKYPTPQDKVTHQHLFQNLNLVYIFVPLNCAATPLLYVVSNGHYRKFLLSKVTFCYKDKDKTITQIRLEETPV